MSWHSSIFLPLAGFLSIFNVLVAFYLNPFAYCEPSNWSSEHVAKPWMVISPHLVIMFLGILTFLSSQYPTRWLGFYPYFASTTIISKTPQELFGLILLSKSTYASILKWKGNMIDPRRKVKACFLELFFVLVFACT